eukprot:8557206-Alexandrium_andersonii.AAC.1
MVDARAPADGSPATPAARGPITGSPVSPRPPAGSGGAAAAALGPPLLGPRLLADVWPTSLSSGFGSACLSER